MKRFSPYSCLAAIHARISRSKLLNMFYYIIITRGKKKKKIIFLSHTSSMPSRVPLVRLRCIHSYPWGQATSETRPHIPQTHTASASRNRNPHVAASSDRSNRTSFDVYSSHTHTSASNSSLPRSIPFPTRSRSVHPLSPLTFWSHMTSSPPVSEAIA